MIHRVGQHRDNYCSRETGQAKRNISPRTVLVGLAGLAVVADSGFLLQACSPSVANTLFTYRGHSQEVYAVAWSPDSRRIASGSRDRTVQVWNATDGSHVFTYRGHSRSVGAVAWSPDGRCIASGSWDRTVQVWEEK